MDVISAIFSVFNAISTWISGAVQELIPMFWASGSLTFLGSLAVVGLGISVIFLLLSVISNYLHFRG